MADMMMNRGKFTWSLKDRIKNIILSDDIMNYLISMRWSDYYAEAQYPPHMFPLVLFHKFRYKKLGKKLGFSIGCSSLGYGLVIPHYGTIVVGGTNRIGNYAVLHTSTCITNNGKNIGNALYLATGAKLIKDIKLGDNVSVASNSVVNNDFIEGNCLLAGMPAVKKCDTVAWYVRDGERFAKRVELVEALRNKMNL